MTDTELDTMPPSESYQHPDGKRERVWRAPVVAKIAGTTYMNIYRWTDQGYLTSLPTPPGPGYQHRYTYTEVMFACDLVQLRNLGLPTPAAFDLLVRLDHQGFVKVGQFTIARVTW